MALVCSRFCSASSQAIWPAPECPPPNKVLPHKLATFTIFALQDHAWFIATEVNVNGWMCACYDHGVYFDITNS
jgi:hypothetical protein